MASQHLDKLVKSFLSGSSNPLVPGFDPFYDLQDPTFLTFKIDFFPDGGFSVPDYTGYSSGGLFRKANALSSLANYSFGDSAADYLRNIGAPNRQQYLEIFIRSLYDLQTFAPWYFQSISGMADLYKIDPAMNYRGKDKVLTIECLESVDMRMTRLADMYRNAAFDMQGMREILPVNLRTFNMAIHVLEMRRFNTTFGAIADAVAQRSLVGQNRQQQAIDATRKNVFSQGSTSLFKGTFDNIGGIASAVNNAAGGIFTNLGSQAGQDPNFMLESAFEAISVQTFILKDCEFDFFSEAPGYLDTVSVKDINEATTRFKINCK